MEWQHTKFVQVCYFLGCSCAANTYGIKTLSQIQNTRSKLLNYYKSNVLTLFGGGLGRWTWDLLPRSLAAEKCLQLAHLLPSSFPSAIPCRLLISNMTFIWCIREAIPYQNPCFFYKVYKRGGGSFPFIKIYDGKFVYSGGLWQHEIGIEKVF